MCPEYDRTLFFSTTLRSHGLVCHVFEQVRAGSKRGNWGIAFNAGEFMIFNNWFYHLLVPGCTNDGEGNLKNEKPIYTSMCRPRYSGLFCNFIIKTTAVGTAQHWPITSVEIKTLTVQPNNTHTHTQTSQLKTNRC